MGMAVGWAMPIGQLVLLIGCVVGVGEPLYELPTPVVVAARIVGGAAILFVIPALLSLGPALSPLPFPRWEGALATTGAYGVVRHPAYTGLMVGGLLLAASEGRISNLACAALLVVLLHVKARWEERLLRERFPDYDAYARRVPRFVPRIG